MTLKEAIVRRRDLKPTDIWALQDVSLHVEPGRSIGFVGRNGSGKTTLLRLIAGIFGPTTGPRRGRRLGRLAARARRRLPPRLHGARERLPERIDLRAQAALRSTSDSRRSSISPSSTGSSTSPCALTRPGCRCGSDSRSRSHIRADVLLLDEVFAVGDEAFQRKCVNKIIEFTGRVALSASCRTSPQPSSICATEPCCSGMDGSSTTARPRRR